MTVVTRFAPSPTGLLHIGSARTALFNYLFAKHNNGKFLLRIEDTDKKRSTPEAKEAIVEGLSWLGLEYDKAPTYQSSHEKRHREIALSLLEKGEAYYCYTQQDELATMRKEAEDKKEVFRFKSPWRDKKPAENISIKPVIRIKTPSDGFSIIKDLVQGEIKVANAELDDLIILRSDGTPTYNLAVVVDDYDSGITHVIRGDDHLNNSFRQKVIYEAMGWELPELAHIPLIHDKDGSKMSKRHGAASVTEYEKMGYLSVAMRNYLLRLGWSHGDSEIISDEEAIKWFDLSKVGKSPSRFDFDKLNNLNKHYLKELDEGELLSTIGLNTEINKDKFLKALHFAKERSSNLIDLKESLKIYEDGFIKTINAEEKEIASSKIDLINKIKQIIANINDWNLDLIKSSILNYAKEYGFKMKEFGPALRIALTFSSSSAGGIFNIIEILGKDETIRRLELINKI
jgi:glutamyl-tRNA synthetase